MHKVLYDIEDYFEDRSLSGGPWWRRHLMRSLARTFGEAGDLIAFR